MDDSTWIGMLVGIRPAAINILMRAGIDTVGKLAKHTENELNDLRYMTANPENMKSIKEGLAQAGRSLKQ